MLVQTQWEPLVPHVTMNLYQEGVAKDGVTPTLTLVDTTETSSWDDWAQGFHTGPGGEKVPNMNCPGQTTGDLFYFSLFNQPQYLDLYNNVLHPGGTGSTTQLPYHSQFKCYDGMHNWNQLQPAVYDGMYSFPSVTVVRRKRETERKQLQDLRGRSGNRHVCRHSHAARRQICGGSGAASGI